jgi:uncharacterized protein involved in exopolysaccharide biosynthesis
MKVREDGQRPHESRTDFPEYARALWRKKYFIVIPVVLSGIISVVGVRFLRPVYMSFSVIQMEDKKFLSREVAPLVALEERQTGIEAVADKETAAKLTGQIQSSVFLDELIDRLGIAQNPAVVGAAEADRKTAFPHLTTEEIVYRRLRDMLVNKIKTSVAGPGMFRISCYDYSPETSYRLADGVTNLLIDRQQHKRLEGLRQANEFSDEQLQVYKQRLEESERRLEELQSQITGLALQGNPVGESRPEYTEEFGGKGSLRYAETLRERLDITVSEMKGVVEKTRKRIVTWLGAVPQNDALRSDPEVRKLSLGLVSLRESQLRLDLAAQGVKTADVGKNLEQIQAAENELQRRLDQVVDMVLQDVGVDYRPLVVEYYLQSAILHSYEAELSRLASYIYSFKEKLDLTPQLETQRVKLSEEVKTNRELYNSFLQAKTSVQISEAAQSTSLGMTMEILERPSKPMYPAKPNRMNIIILALVFGLALGVGGLVVSEYMDTSFRGVEDIEKELDLKVLGAVPSIDSQTGWDRRRSRRQMIIWVSTGIVVVVVSLAGFYMYGKITGKQAARIDAGQSAGE